MVRAFAKGRETVLIVRSDLLVRAMLCSSVFDMSVERTQDDAQCRSKGVENRKVVKESATSALRSIP